MRAKCLAAAVTLCVTAALAGCGNGGPEFDANGDKRVVLRTDYQFNGYVAPFALALERGYYRQAGLDVAIEKGQGTATTIQTVATGNDQFGLADSTSAVKAISKEVPVRVVSVYLQALPTGLISLPDSTFDGSVESLRGRPVISSPGNAELAYLDALLAKNGMSTDDVDLRLVNTNARIPTFMQTEDAVLLGFSAGDLIRVRTQRPGATYRSFGDFGMTSYGTGVIASESFLEENPNSARGFLEASRKGWEDAIEDPEAAVQAALKLYPDTSADLTRKGLQVTIDTLLHTEATKNLPLGETADSDWTAMLDLLKEHAGFRGSTDPDNYYSKVTDNDRK